METAEILRPDIIQIPSKEAVTERLRAELPIVPNSPEIDKQDQYIKTSICLSQDREGKYDWYLTYGHKPEGAYEVNPDTNDEDRGVFDIAASLIREGDQLMPRLTRFDGRWWESNVAEQSVQNDLREVFRVQEEDNAIEVMNCSAEDLSEAEIIDLQNAFKAVVNFTGGKIFDRVSGIVLVDNSDLNEKDASGDFSSTYGVVRINMADIRRAGKELYARFQPYFHGREDISITEVILAHELGHAMDTRLLSEVDAHGINKDKVWWMGMGNSTNDFSAFQDHFGWENNIKTKEDGMRKNEWHLNEAIEIECREYAPTTYAKTNPAEDFAETFAVMALDGDMSSMPQRQKLIAETIMKAEAESTIGPKLVTMGKIDCRLGYDPRKLKGLALDVYVAG